MPIFIECVSFFRFLGAPADDDPLPNDASEEHSDDGHSKHDLVSVNITNELGQTKPHLSNGFVWTIIIDYPIMARLID